MFLTYVHGKRYTETGAYFLQKLKACTNGRFQLSTDGWSAFDGLADLTWGDSIDYGQIVKIITGQPGNDAATRYSSGKIREVRKRVCSGEPDWDRISTSFAERGNLTVRMINRRMTRLTNAFSKKWENHEAMMALCIGVYNFCRIHRSLRVTPAMEAGIATQVWGIENLISPL